VKIPFVPERLWIYCKDECCCSSDAIADPFHLAFCAGSKPLYRLTLGRWTVQWYRRSVSAPSNR
jgi:hypothetical protein